MHEKSSRLIPALVLALLLALTAACTPGGDGETTNGDTPKGSPATGSGNQGEIIEVELTDFAIEMPSSISAGTTTFKVTNQGDAPHNFEIEGNGIEEKLESNLQPGQSGELTVDLQPGTYEVYCPVGNHDDLGMKLELTVE